CAAARQDRPPRSMDMSFGEELGAFGGQPDPDAPAGPDPQGQATPAMPDDGQPDAGQDDSQDGDEPGWDIEDGA
ncbi:hypothetical protein, partial [Meridianimarinicoccus zhengii]|uniref:hypothetical protein n=1 Tax=Meridianimarinicoccus zhengii TaxID=2056810 RepID=UPI001C9A8E0E